MAEAVAHAFDTGEHLAVQAGTGTGKSLAYLVPAIARAVDTDEPVVVSTATIALQRQLVDRDLPRLADSLADALPRRPEFALLKGRGNYLCLNKIHNGSATEPEDRPQEELFEPMAATALGRDVQRLIAWSSTTEHRRPRRADAGCAGPVVVSGVRIGPGMHRRGPLPVRHRLLRGEGPRQGWPRRCRRHQPRAAGHRRDDRRRRAARTRAAGRRRGARAGGPGDRRGHRRAVGHVARALRTAASRRLIDPELAQRLEAATATFSSAIHDATPGRIDVLDDEMTTYLTALRDAASRGPLGDRHRTERPEGGVGARRGGDGADRHQRHRDTHPGVVRPCHPRPHRRGLARSR